MSKLRIALIVMGWKAITQRPHHWEKQATRRGHKVDVFTVNDSLISSLLPQTSDQSTPNVHRQPKGFYETILARAGKVEAARAEKRQRFTRYIQSKVIDQLGINYDLAIYASPPTGFLKLHSNTHANKGVLVYDCMDDWHNFPGSVGHLQDWEKSLAAQSTFVTVVSSPLVTKMQQFTSTEKVLLIPNGCEYEFFVSSPKTNSTSRDANLLDTTKTDKMIIGFTGSLEDWFDWAVIDALALRFPDAEIRLVGPGHAIPTQLPENVKLFGRQPYETMPAYMASFDVCIIPFRLDKSYVASVSPIKLYEYLAAGKPVVSTSMPDVVQFSETGVVHIADTPEEFSQEVAKAAFLTREPTLIAKRQSIARAHSWEARWSKIEQMALQYLSKRHTTL